MIFLSSGCRLPGAEGTINRRWSFERIMSTAREMAFASASEVPPNLQVMAFMVLVGTPVSSMLLCAQGLCALIRRV